MFKDHGSDNAQHGGRPAGAAALSRAQIIRPETLQRFSGFADRYEQWRQRASVALGAIDLAPDLASGIGSRRWLRGAATLLGLSAIALGLSPDFAPLQAKTPMGVDERVRDEFRSQMIMPLALGGDSGRRMGATRDVVALRSAPERPRLDLVATLAGGDSFERMLLRAGVGAAEAGRVAQMVAGAMPLDEIAAGDPGRHHARPAPRSARRAPARCPVIPRAV